MKEQGPCHATRGRAAARECSGSRCARPWRDVPSPRAAPTRACPDSCNSKEEALASTDCALALDNTARLGYISTSEDQDFYALNLPATLTARSLVEVRAGYGASNTAVNLAVNVLSADGVSSIARARISTARARPSRWISSFPFSQPNARLLVLLADQDSKTAAAHTDVHAQYSVQARIFDNPDVNEPNDTTPTAIALTGGPPYASGTQTGYLATTNDVDRYAVVVPKQTGPRRILYVRVTADKISPPPPYRLAYTLLAPDGTPVQEGHADNEFIAVDLATARLADLTPTPSPEATWQVVVQAYHSPNTPGPVAGDLRQPYHVEVRLMDEQDAREPNDTAAAGLASPVVVSAPSNTQTYTATGRLDHMPDRDWFGYALAANAAPTVLHYQVTWSGGAGRFPPLPGVVDRQVRVVSQVAGGQAACKTDATVCPKGDEGDPAVAAYALSYCDQTPTLCLRSERNESLVFPGLRNFEGVIPIPPHAADFNVLFMVGDDGNNWADDRDYTLSFQWLPDADEAGRTTGGVEQVAVLPMAVDNPTNAGFPAPPASATVLSGTLSHGYGRLLRHAPTSGDGLRAALDYDAVPSDVDRYEVDLPAVDPAAGPMDRTWELQWTVDHTPDGGYAYDLGLDVTFCDGDRRDGGACTPVGTGNGHPFTLSYVPDAVASWHNPNQMNGLYQPVYDRAVTAAGETVTARAYGCFCFEPRLVRGGKLYVNVTGVDRSRYDEVPYAVRMAMTGYPKSYGVDGGTRSCPPPPADGGVSADGGVADAGPGCHFTGQ